MSQEEIEAELKILMIDALKLEDLSPEDIDTGAPLVGEGLGLDSIDILELAMAVHRRFGVQTDSDDVQGPKIYASVRNLAAHIVLCRGVPSGATAGQAGSDVGTKAEPGA